MGNSVPTVILASGNRWTRLRDKMMLDELWQSGRAPWRLWK